MDEQKVENEETKQQETKKETKNIFEQIMDTKDSTSEFDKQDIEGHKGMAVLSYILPFIPYFVTKDSKYVKYHSTQGMNLLIIAIAYSILYGVLTSIIKVKQVGWLGLEYEMTPGWLTTILGLVGLVISILAIIGIVNVCNGKAKELPLVNKVKIFK